jgi:hypothetical protein
MTERRSEFLGLDESVKSLLAVLQDIQRAAHVFSTLEEFASANWGEDSYACFDWIGLTRRMFRSPLLAFDELRRIHRKEMLETVLWCHERITAIMDRSWFERSSGPGEIVATLHTVLARIQLDLAAKGRHVANGGEPPAFDLPPNNSLEDTSPTSTQVFEDPSSSFWLKDALRSALRRDPVDAANDSEALARVLNDRCREALKVPTSLDSIAR